MTVRPILLLTGPRAAAVAAAVLEYHDHISIYDSAEIYPGLSPDDAVANLMCDTWHLEPRVLTVISAPEIGPEDLPCLASGPAAVAVLRYHTDAYTAAGITACHLVPRARGVR